MKVLRAIKSLFANRIQIKNGAEALATASFSVILSIIVAGLLSMHAYAIWPIYSEFVAGGTIFSGYNKQGDMLLFYALLFSLPLFSIIFLLFKHRKKWSYVNNENSKKCYVNREGQSVDNTNEEKTIAYENSYKWLASYAAIIIMFAFSIIAFETAISGRMIEKRALLASIRNYLIATELLIGVLVLICILVKKMQLENVLRFGYMFSQVLLPFCFLGYFGFYYRYENESNIIELFHSGKWKYFCIAVFLILMVEQSIRLLKKKSGIACGSMIAIASMSIMKMPSGIMSVDFFHNGEMALPMQQYMAYGKLPYFDLDPIHGLCDYVYSLFNYAFFDGTYMSQSAGVVAAQLCMAMLYAIILAFFYKEREISTILIWLFMPYLVEKAGIRYVVLFSAFLILFSKKVRRNSLWFIWWWILLCIVGITYNVSIGLSMAVAFFPEVIYRIIKDIVPLLKKWREIQFESLFSRENGALTIAGCMLFIWGICYIPVFAQIMRFLQENAATTLWVNGTPIFGDEFHFVETFAVFVPYLAILILTLSSKKIECWYYIDILMCLVVITNYACVRYDEGLRIAVLGVLFGFIFLLCFAQDWAKSKLQWICYICVLIAAIMLIRGYLPIRSHALMEVEVIPANKELEISETQVQDPVVYVSGDSVAMDNLGTGFIQGLTLNSLKNIQFVLQSEDALNSWLDLTNKISHSVIFNSEYSCPFTSAYNISNDLMQEKAIAYIKETQPRLILLSPYIRFDEAPISLRSPKMYQAILDMGYEPYVYEDVIYMLSGSSTCSEAADGRRMFGMLNHRTDLGMLPYLWGTALENEKDGLIQIAGEQDWGNVNGKEVQYLDIIVDRDTVEVDNANDVFTVSFQSTIDGERYQFLVKTGADKIDNTTNKVMQKNEEIHYLIPLFSSPFFSYSDGVNIQIDGIRYSDVRFYQTYE